MIVILASVSLASTPGPSGLRMQETAVSTLEILPAGVYMISFGECRQYSEKSRR